jgi:hypothetical protein
MPTTSISHFFFRTSRTRSRASYKRRSEWATGVRRLAGMLERRNDNPHWLPAVLPRDLAPGQWRARSTLTQPAAPPELSQEAAGTLGSARCT